MRFFTTVTALLCVRSGSTYTSTIPLVKRAIYMPSEYTMPGGRNISSVVAWTYAAFAHATVTISNSTTELSYLCKNFNDLSSRYIDVFAQPDGDVTKLAKEVICDASKSSNPSPLPVSQNMLWYMKTYTAGILNLQAYSAKNATKQWYIDMCYFLEASLLRGLWAPCRDSDEGGVDVESGFCSAAGQFGKGPYSKYTDATQTAAIVRQADVHMSKVMARVFKVVAQETKQIEFVCNSWKRFEAGIKNTGLVPDVVKELICGQNKVVEVKQARLDLIGEMTDLFILQVLNAGDYEGYHAYLCKTFSADALGKYNLNGAKVIDAVCQAAD